MSIADKITQLTTIRASMREKLVAKGVDASTHNFADFPNDVESIPSGGGLPAEYEAVEYIESTGTQYIDTGYIPNNTTTVICVAEKGTAGDDNYYVMGARKGAMNSAFAFIFMKTSSQFRSDFYNNNGTVTNYSGGKVLIVKSQRWTKIGNNTDSVANGTFSADNNLFLFAWNNNGTAMLSSSKVKIYTAQIYDDLTLVRNLVPCIRKADDEAGLYDLVNGVFYTNQGTGSFIVPSV